MEQKMLEPKHFTKLPSVCPKPNCGGKLFMLHPDGWQCWKCMKIIYKANHYSPPV